MQSSLKKLPKPNTKVLVAMSGGVDSSVAALLLKQAGYNVIGVHLHFWADPVSEDNKHLPENKCCSTESLLTARAVANKLKIPFYVFNFADFFKNKVVGHFLSGYKKGETPNPCAVCNKEIKFGKLLNKTKELGCDFIATGHYARISKANKKFQLMKGKDKTKDQSYFLYHLGQKKLARILLPLGNYKKTEIKKLAEKAGFKKLSKQKESQGTCFFAERTPHPFLRRHLPKTSFRSGTIKDTGNKTLGTHQGLPLYTIGQREGLNIGGLQTPLYVKSKDKQTNTLIVGKDSDIFTNKMTVKNLSFTADNPPKINFKATVVIRYHHKGEQATINLHKNKAEVTFSKPVRAITPGQVAAFYNKDELIGGGIIES